MKKNLLFVIPSLGAGGGEKSLVNLLDQINFDQYNVDLFLFSKSGIFINSLPEEVEILEHSEDFKLFSKTLLNSVVGFIKKGKLKLATARVQFFLKNKNERNKAIAEQQSWKFVSQSIPKLTKKYDCAIGFLEKSSIYFTVDKVNADKKIGFIHNDYNKLNLDASFDIKYFEKLSTIATVSEECAVVLKNKFRNQSQKIEVIYNIISVSVINKLANEKIIIEPSQFVLLSIGRLHPQKGFDFAVDSALILKENNISFKWLIIGEGDERSNLEKLIKEKRLDDNFILLGLKENPYPYLKQADIYVQPSRYEGKSIAVDEAKILQKPIILTNFTTAKDQINNGENGMIVEMNPKSIAEGIINLIDNKELQEKFSLNLSKEKLGTEGEINKLYQLING